MLQRSNGAAQYQSAPTGVHVTSITSLRETTPNHSFSTRLLRVIVALVERWNIQPPPIVEEALAPSPTENPMALPTENLQYSLHPRIRLKTTPTMDGVNPCYHRSHGRHRFRMRSQVRFPVISLRQRWPVHCLTLLRGNSIVPLPLMEFSHSRVIQAVSQ